MNESTNTILVIVIVSIVLLLAFAFIVYRSFTAKPESQTITKLHSGNRHRFLFIGTVPKECRWDEDNKEFIKEALNNSSTNSVALSFIDYEFRHDNKAHKPTYIVNADGASNFTGVKLLEQVLNVLSIPYEFKFLIYDPRGIDGTFCMNARIPDEYRDDVINHDLNNGVPIDIGTFDYVYVDTNTLGFVNDASDRRIWLNMFKELVKDNGYLVIDDVDVFKANYEHTQVNASHDLVPCSYTYVKDNFVTSLYRKCEFTPEAIEIVRSKINLRDVFASCIYRHKQTTIVMQRVLNNTSTVTVNTVNKHKLVKMNKVFFDVLEFIPNGLNMFYNGYIPTYKLRHIVERADKALIDKLLTYDEYCFDIVEHGKVINKLIFKIKQLHTLYNDNIDKYYTYFKGYEEGFNDYFRGNFIGEIKTADDYTRIQDYEINNLSLNIPKPGKMNGFVYNEGSIDGRYDSYVIGKEEHDKYIVNNCRTNDEYINVNI